MNSGIVTLRCNNEHNRGNAVIQVCPRNRTLSLRPKDIGIDEVVGAGFSPQYFKKTHRTQKLNLEGNFEDFRITLSIDSLVIGVL